MALQGNPFLGKLKLPAPDLSHIPETPFESKPAKPNEPTPPEDALTESNRFQTVSIGVDNRFQTVSDIGFNRFQTVSDPPVQEAKSSKECANGNLLKPIETVINRFQPVSDIGFKLPPIGELCVLRYLADREPAPGAPISVRRRDLATATAQTLSGVKTALIRLTRTQVLELVEFKCGKVNGFTSYQLTEKARIILASKGAVDRLGFNRFQTVSIGFLSSSSSLLEKNFKTTTTGDPVLFEEDRVQLAPEWANIDVAPLSDIGFTWTHLLQLVRDNKLTASEVQDSIHFFAFDLKKNGKDKVLKGPALNFFMGIMRKGLPYAPPENFESEADEARRKTREFKERKERERKIEDQKIFEMEFSEWKRGLSPDSRAKLLPEYARKPGTIQDAALNSYFEENIWPDRAQELLGLAGIDRAEIGKQIDQSLTGKTE